MIPEVVVAMLACARIGAPHNVVFGGFSAEAVRERMEFSEAKVLITVDGAARKGKTAPVKDRVDEVMGDLQTLEKIVVVRSKGTPCQMQEGRDVFYDEISRPPTPSARPSRWTPSTRCTSSTPPAPPPSRRASCTPPAATSRGSSATHRYVFDLKPESDVYWCAADVGWVTGHSYIVYGPLAQRRHLGDVGGRAGLPPQGHLVGDHRALRRHASSTAPPPRSARASSGARSGRSEHDLSSLRLLGIGGRADQPEGVALVPQGDRRRALPDRRHLVADRDRRDHDHPAARASPPPSRAPATRPFPGVRPRCYDESTGEPIEEGQGLLVLTRPWPSMLRTLYKEEERFIETYFKRFGPETYLVGDAARRDADGYLWVIGRIDDVVNVSGHRLSTAEVESAIVAHPDVAEAAVIGQHDEDTGQAIVAFVTLQGDLEGDERDRRGHPRDGGRADRQVRAPQAHHLGRRPAQDTLRQDHAPPAARHRRGPRAGRCHHAARPRSRSVGGTRVAGPQEGAAVHSISDG